MMSDEKWYLLYDGDSPDGMGEPEYVGRTIDPKVAQDHYAKVSSDPYSTGKVVVITDTEETLFEYQ